MKDIGKRLRNLRNRLGISQLELSNRSGISQASIARIETNQQKNLKARTLQKLADSLGITVSALIEEPVMIKEERPPYPAPKMLPVITLDKFREVKKVSDLEEKAGSFEPSLSSDDGAFFLMATPGLLSRPIINEGDLLLIEPGSSVKEDDIVLFLSHEYAGIGQLFRHSSIYILQPLNHESSPRVLKREEIKRPGVRILRVSEIRRKL